MLKSVVNGVVLCFFGIAIALGITEGLFRVIGRSSPQVTKWSDRPEYYFAAESASTLQDYQYPPKKNESTYRVAVIGDSFTFAPFMQFTDAFPKKLEQMLNLNSVPLKGEVINYGVPAYSTAHEVGVTERALAEEADLVLLQITLNDPELKPYTPTGIRQDLPDRFAEYKPTGWKKTLFSYWKSAEFVAKRLHNSYTHEEYRKYFTDLFENKRSRSQFERSIKRIVSLCRKAGKPIVATVFPLFGTPLDDRYPFENLHKQVGELFTELQVPVLDLRDTYKDIPTERLLVIPGVDRHPNEIAHRMAAEQIYKFLLSKELIPEELRIRKRYATRIGTVKQPEYNE